MNNSNNDDDHSDLDDIPEAEAPSMFPDLCTPIATGDWYFIPDEEDE